MKMEVAVKEYSQIMEAVIAVLDRLVSLMSAEIISNNTWLPKNIYIFFCTAYDI